VADRISEADEMTLRVLAIIEDTTVAGQRREAIRSYARRARQDPRVAEIVGLILASRRRRSNGGANVITMGDRNG